MIAIVDYGMGNLRSVSNKFHRLGVDCIITSDPYEIEKADKLVLPGVGHFRNGMLNLEKLNLVDVLNQRVLSDKIKIFGICLGVQLFCNRSDEGNCDGLGWIDAEVVRFDVSDKLKYKVPHMGWNNVDIKNANGIDISFESEQFYFVHSYHLKCNDKADVWMCSTYDYEFVSAIRKENIYGTQFHPEKSHDIGLELLKKFAEL